MAVLPAKRLVSLAQGNFYWYVQTQHIFETPKNRVNLGNF